MFPPFPSWDGLHVLVVHFPVALTVVTPLLILLALLIPPLRRGFAIAALVLMVIGTVAAFVAVSTGEAAEELAERNTQVDAALERHQGIAQTARTYLAIFTILFALVLFGPSLLKRPLGAPVQTLLLAVMFVGGLAGSLLIANVAHQGGRLVHVFGVHAMLEAAPAGTTSSGTAAPGRRDED